MSDTWYRDPVDIPPYDDGQGRLWTYDGKQVGGPPPPPPLSDAESEALAEDIRASFRASFRAWLGAWLDS